MMAYDALAHRAATMRYLQGLVTEIRLVSENAAVFVEVAVVELAWRVGLPVVSEVTPEPGDALNRLIYAVPDVQSMEPSSASALRAAIHFLIEASIAQDQPSRVSL